MSNITLLTRLLSNIRSVVGLPDEIEQKVSALTALTFASRETHQDMRAEARLKVPQWPPWSTLPTPASFFRRMSRSRSPRPPRSLPRPASAEGWSIVRWRSPRTNYWSPHATTPTRSSSPGCARRCTRHWNAFLTPPD